MRRTLNALKQTLTSTSDKSESSTGLDPEDSLAGLGPSALRVNAKTLELPSGVCASFAVAGYPREVGAGWLEPLLTHPGRLECPCTSNRSHH